METPDPNHATSLDEFLESPTAAHAQDILVYAIYMGIMKAFWRILFINVLIVAVLLSLWAILAVLVGGA